MGGGVVSGAASSMLYRNRSNKPLKRWELIFALIILFSPLIFFVFFVVVMILMRL